MRASDSAASLSELRAGGTAANGALGAGAAAGSAGGITAIRRIRRFSRSLDCLLCKFAGAKLQAETSAKQSNHNVIGLSIIAVETSRTSASAQEKLARPRL